MKVKTPAEIKQPSTKRAAPGCIALIVLWIENHKILL